MFCKALMFWSVLSTVVRPIYINVDDHSNFHETDDLVTVSKNKKFMWRVMHETYE